MQSAAGLPCTSFRTMIVPFWILSSTCQPLDLPPSPSASTTHHAHACPSRLAGRDHHRLRACEHKMMRTRTTRGRGREETRAGAGAGTETRAEAGAGAGAGAGGGEKAGAGSAGGAG
eukprot:746976-Hanusia_phi.AAC.2